ncbi:TPA: KAP family NTPase [Serratia liquefaciens]|nr:KAP family NTPase [Serratia liquefaciens]
MLKLNNDITFDIRDEFQRKKIAEKIATLITSDIDTSPMIINGGWGTGKTEFCYKLINLLKETHPQYKTVYIDAFNEDHTDSPILTVLAAIITLLPEKEGATLIQKALPALRFGLKTTLKASAGWILRQNANDVTEEFQEAIKETSNAVIDSTVESLLKDHVESDKNIRTLKTALQEISQKNPIVIFIDELDRCKPSFSISILENIKHVFDVENVHFVLITNTQQLEASINHLYGQSVDAKRYLDKFIRFTFTLPNYLKPDNHTSTYTSTMHWDNIISDSPSLGVVNGEAGKFIKSIIEKGMLSLREVETFARYIDIYQSVSPNKITDRTYFGYTMFWIIGIYFYCFNKELAIDLSMGNIDIDKIAEVLNTKDFNYNPEKYPGYLTIAFYALLNESNKPSQYFTKPNDEQKKIWDELVGGLFRTAFHAPDSLCQVVTDSIEVLQLKK